MQTRNEERKEKRERNEKLKLPYYPLFLSSSSNIF